jgi:thiol-disulfide isomerase/thioredoxin
LNYKPESFQWNIFKSDSLSREEVIEKRKQEELDLFKNLLEEKKITSSFYTLIENDRNCFYAFASAWLYSWEVLRILRNRHDNYDEAKMAEIVDTLTGIYEKHKPDDNNLMKSPQWKHYALFMYIRVYKQYLFKEVNTNNVEALLSREHIPFWFIQIKESFQGNALEAVLALFLYETGGLSNCIDTDTTIPVYDFFLEQFPQSPYLKYFKNQMEETVAFYEEKDFDPSVHFVEPRDSINTFQELLALFRGTRLYVDVWATWCGPCRMQFEYKDLLEPILQRNNITPLYISTDHDDKQIKTWEALIKGYNLRGYHFRANKSFLEDLNGIYDPDNAHNPESKRSFLIPWYMLIDEKGNIVNKHFKRPSELVKDTLAIF